MIKCQFEKATSPDASLRHVTVGCIAINENGEVLLVKRAEHLSRGGKYTIPGGFLDRDEDTKEGALRELKEETGMKGEIISLFHINDYPNRPHEDRQNVDFIYLIKINGGDYKENSEVIDIGWFDENNLPTDEEFAFDHRTAILKYFEYKRQRFSLPLVGMI